MSDVIEDVCHVCDVGRQLGTVFFHPRTVEELVGRYSPQNVVLDEGELLDKLCGAEIAYIYPVGKMGVPWLWDAHRSSAVEKNLLGAELDELGDLGAKIADLTICTEFDFAKKSV